MSSKKAKGKRSKTRDLFKPRHGRTKVNDILKEFNEGERVVFRINPSFHAGLPHRRFQNLSGKVVEKRGKAYVLQVMHGNKQKQIITCAVHLKAA